MGIELSYIQPGKPMQNGYVERFNGSFRREILDLYYFRTIKKVKDIAEEWMIEYNYQRPHDSFGNISPIEFFQKQLVL
jgi:putative transposase